jgi:LemA protein
MSSLEPKIPEKLTPEVFTIASRLYAQASQEYSLAQLKQAGLEAQIPPEFIQQAVQEIQTQKIQTRKQRQKLKIVSLSLGVALSIWSIWTYNSLNDAEQKVDSAWAQVENQFQRRSDLIPNLVRTTQASANRDRNLVTLLTQSQQKFLQASTPTQKIAANLQIDRAIAQFEQHVAQDPRLSSAQAFTNLQYELAGTENRIAVERMRYNQAVHSYNRQVKLFPTSLISPVLGFRPRSFFQAATSEVPAAFPVTK